jgi:hypothetical protein
MLINDFGVFAFEIAHLTKMKSAIVFERKFLVRKMLVVGKFEAVFFVHVLLHFERARKWKLKSWFLETFLTRAGKVTSFLSALISPEMAGRSEAKNTERFSLASYF